MEWKTAPISRQELPEALSLCREVFMEFEAPGYSSEGVQSFLDFIEENAASRMAATGLLEFLGVWQECQLIAAGALREREHISLLFVRKAFHRQGVGSALLDCMLSRCREGLITVNSSPFGLPFYLAKGFSPLTKEQEKHGIRFIPMERLLGGPAVRVRPLLEEELPAAWQLEQLSFPDPWSQKGLRDTFRESRACFLAAEAEGFGLCGFVNATWVLDELNLNRICVHPCFRRRGVGKKLMAALKAFCPKQQIRRIFLEVRASNGPARCFYQREGFAETGRRPRFYEHPEEDAVLMVWDGSPSAKE